MVSTGLGLGLGLRDCKNCKDRVECRGDRYGGEEYSGLLGV